MYFYQYFGTAKGGWSTRVYEMTRRWVQQGHEVTVVTTPYDKSDIPKGKGLSYTVYIEGVRVIVLNFPQSNKNPILKRMLGFAQYITLAVYDALRLDYDVAICSSGPITVGYMGIAARKLRGKKFVFEVRDLWPAGAIQLGILKRKPMIKWAWWFEKRCYQNANLIVAASEGMKQDIQRRHGLQNIIVVPNASDNDVFGNPYLPALPEALKGKQMIMYTGSLGRIDHCMEIMEAARIIDRDKYPQAAVVIIGDGIDRKEMEAYKAEHKLDHVHFLGQMPKVQVAGWLKLALASLLTIRDIPMLHTASPNKIFDSFAASVAIIQTTQGWIKELVEQENCGLNVVPENPALLANAIETYLANPQLAREHGANGKRLAETIFSRDHCAATMIAAIEKLVEYS